MDLQSRIVDALRAELVRQADASGGRLDAQPDAGDELTIHGLVDLGALALVAADVVSGTP